MDMTEAALFPENLGTLFELSPETGADLHIRSQPVGQSGRDIPMPACRVAEIAGSDLELKLLNVDRVGIVNSQRTPGKGCCLQENIPCDHRYLHDAHPLDPILTASRLCYDVKKK